MRTICGTYEYPYYVCTVHRHPVQAKEEICCPDKAFEVRNNTYNDAPDFECPHCGAEYLEFEDEDFSHRDVGRKFTCDECGGTCQITGIDFTVSLVEVTAIYEEGEKS